jgi:uncharacterized protein YutE (UPF0331/DUF86 family)
MSTSIGNTSWKWPMLDKNRILAKIDELDRYLGELRQIAPSTFDEYAAIEKKRSSERLLQLCVECVIDVCKLLVVQLRLGLPSEESDLFRKLEKERILSPENAETLRRMRGFRNILIHEYAEVDDNLVFEFATTRLQDFEAFKKEIIAALKR